MSLTHPIAKIAHCLRSIESWNEIGGQSPETNDIILNTRIMIEEVDEYLQAAQIGDRKEVKDALADMFYVLWGIVCKEGVRDEFWDVLEEVCASNMSKFDTNSQDAIESVVKYAEKGIKATYKWNEKHQVYVIYREDGKILKSYKFKEPNINA
jgi:NTP pyrophosphatase (non-canonical NTP hydrolase)